MFGIRNDILFNIKCLLNTQGEIFIFIMVISGLFFFSTLIIFSEIGYLLYAYEQFPAGSADLLAALDERKILTTYYNTFWNMVVTFSTIGYGDMYV